MLPLDHGVAIDKIQGFIRQNSGSKIVYGVLSTGLESS